MRETTNNEMALKVQLAQSTNLNNEVEVEHPWNHPIEGK